MIQCHPTMMVIKRSHQNKLKVCVCVCGGGHSFKPRMCTSVLVLNYYVSSCMCVFDVLYMIF